MVVLTAFLPKVSVEEEVPPVQLVYPMFPLEAAGETETLVARLPSPMPEPLLFLAVMPMAFLPKASVAVAVMAV